MVQLRVWSSLLRNQEVTKDGSALKLPVYWHCRSHRWTKLQTLAREAGAGEARHGQANFRGKEKMSLLVVVVRGRT